MRRTIATLTLALWITPVLSQQERFPLPYPLGECVVVDATESIGEPIEDDYGRSEFVIPGDVAITFVPGNLCSAYARAGWEETISARGHRNTWI